MQLITRPSRSCSATPISTWSTIPAEVAVADQQLRDHRQNGSGYQIFRPRSSSDRFARSDGHHADERERPGESARSAASAGEQLPQNVADSSTNLAHLDPAWYQPVCWTEASTARQASSIFIHLIVQNSSSHPNDYWSFEPPFVFSRFGRPFVMIVQDRSLLTIIRTNCFGIFWTLLVFSPIL